MSKDELRRLATAATPGPWQKCGGYTPKYCAITTPTEYIVWGMADYKEDREANGQEINAPTYDQQQNNAAYIAATSPDVVLSLLDENAALSERIMELEKLDDASEGTFKHWRARALAAEANVAALSERVEKLQAALERFCTIMEHCSVTSGVCCCGDNMDGHSYMSGHSPTDQGAYCADQAFEEARALLALSHPEKETP